MRMGARTHLQYNVLKARCAQSETIFVTTVLIGYTSKAPGVTRLAKIQSAHASQYWVATMARVRLQS
jgi:hypothetical protein